MGICTLPNVGWFCPPPREPNSNGPKVEPSLADAGSNRTSHSNLLIRVPSRAGLMPSEPFITTYCGPQQAPVGGTAEGNWALIFNEPEDGLLLASLAGSQDKPA